MSELLAVVAGFAVGVVVTLVAAAVVAGGRADDDCGCDDAELGPREVQRRIEGREL